MNEPTRTWPCQNCGRTVERYRGQNDVQCECGAWYNCFGQRLRDNWMNNPSNWDENIGDMEGYEMELIDRDRGAHTHDFHI